MSKHHPETKGHVTTLPGMLLLKESEARRQWGLDASVLGPAPEKLSQGLGIFESVVKDLGAPPIRPPRIAMHREGGAFDYEVLREGLDRVDRNFVEDLRQKLSKLGDDEEED